MATLAARIPPPDEADAGGPVVHAVPASAALGHRVAPPPAGLLGCLERRGGAAERAGVVGQHRQRRVPVAVLDGDGVPVRQRRHQAAARSQHGRRQDQGGGHQGAELDHRRRRRDMEGGRAGVRRRGRRTTARRPPARSASTVTRGRRETEPRDAPPGRRTRDGEQQPAADRQPDAVQQDQRQIPAEVGCAPAGRGSRPGRATARRRRARHRRCRSRAGRGVRRRRARSPRPARAPRPARR